MACEQTRDHRWPELKCVYTLTSSSASTMAYPLWAGISFPLPMSKLVHYMMVLRLEEVVSLSAITVMYGGLYSSVLVLSYKYRQNMGQFKDTEREQAQRGSKKVIASNSSYNHRIQHSQVTHIDVKVWTRYTHKPAGRARWIRIVYFLYT